MKLRKSIYNFMYEKDDKIVVFNTFTKCCVKLDHEYIKIVEQPFEYYLGKDNNIDYLYKNGILVKDDFDENAFLRYFYQKTCFAREYMSLTIAPTLACNFDCPYCFEKKRSGKMSLKIQQNIINFVEKKIEEGVKILEVSFYGGEPLLCFDVVNYITLQIERLIEQYSIKVKYGIITNGYLLDKQMVDFFEKYNFSIQITVDGMAEMHDKRRYLVNRDATWDRIVNNLYLFNKKEINVYIRMNIDKENKDDYYNLAKFVEGYENPRMIVYPSLTEEINDTDTRDIYMSDDNYDSFILDKKNQSVFKNSDKEIPISNDVSKIPDKRCYHCTAELDNTCVIDERGNVYKCWDEVGLEEYICFNVSNLSNQNYNNITRYVSDSLFYDEKCSKCNKLPICFGGCKFHRNHFSKLKCAYSDETLKNYIETKIIK